MLFLKLDIYLIDNKYEFKVVFINQKLTLYFYNTDFLYSDVLLHTEKVFIRDQIFDIDGNSDKLFSYKTWKVIN